MSIEKRVKVLEEKLDKLIESLQNGIVYEGKISASFPKTKKEKEREKILKRHDEDGMCIECKKRKAALGVLVCGSCLWGNKLNDIFDGLDIKLDIK